MRYIFRFPDIGEGITEGKILKWYVEKGRRVSTGDPVVQMETDKVVADIPSPKDGVVAARFGKVGEVIHVEDPLVEIDVEGVIGEDAQAAAKHGPAPSRKEAVQEKGFGVVGTLEVAGDAAYLPAGDEGVFSVAPPRAPEEKPARVTATPTARAMAREMGVEVRRVRGTGPGGRVTKEDVRSYADDLRAAKAPAAPKHVDRDEPEGPRVEVIPLTQTRKAIARNMSISKHTAAHMTLTEEVDVSELARLRQVYKPEFEAMGVRLTFLPFVVKSAVEGLKRHPTLNAELDLEGGRVVLKKYYNIGVAVDADEGLVVPVLRDADRKSVAGLARDIAAMAARAKDRKLALDDFKDGTFTITNYGAIGGLFGVPVINYPQVAILGLGRIHQKAVVKGGQVVPATVLPLSLSVDHRLVDGGEAARFVNRLMMYLSDPFRLLVE